MPFPLIPLALAGAGIAAKVGSQAASKSGKMKQFPIRSPEQIGLQKWAGQRAQEQISNPMQGFDPIAALSQTQYKQNILPAILERFGSRGALTSPSLQSTLARSGGDLQERLAALGSDYSMQQQQLGQNLLNMSLMPQFENIYQPGGHTMLSSLLSGIGDAAGSYGQMGMLSHFLGNQGQQQQIASPGSEPMARTDVNRLLDPIYSQGQTGMNQALGGNQSPMEQRFMGPANMQMPYTPQQGLSNLMQYINQGGGMNPLRGRGLGNTQYSGEFTNAANTSKIPFLKALLNEYLAPQGYQFNF